MRVLKFKLVLLLLFYTVTGMTTESLPMHRIGECTLTLEASPKWSSLRLRAHHAGIAPCQIDQTAVQNLLNESLGKVTEFNSYKSLGLGRIIDFPWLSNHLRDSASRDKNWNQKKGRPVQGGPNGYVKQVLMKKSVLQPFNTALAKYGTRVKGISVEKVLIDKKTRLPFDALVWFELER